MVDEHHATIATEVMQLPLYRFIGLELVTYEPGRSRLELHVGEETMGIGHFHGGFMPALIDAACYFAVLRLLDEDEDCSTTDTATSLLRPVQEDDVIVVSGEVVQRGRTRAFMTAQATVDDRVVAYGHVTKVVIRGGGGPVSA